MFERFTGRARKMAALAQEESGSLRRGYIGTDRPRLELIRRGDDSVSAPFRR